MNKDKQKKERREEKKNKQINMQTYKLNKRKLSFAIYCF